MYAKTGVATRVITKAGLMASGEDYPGLNLSAIFLLAGFRVGESVLIRWDAEEIRISRFKDDSKA